MGVCSSDDYEAVDNDEREESNDEKKSKKTLKTFVERGVQTDESMMNLWGVEKYEINDKDQLPLLVFYYTHNMIPYHNILQYFYLSNNSY